MIQRIKTLITTLMVSGMLFVPAAIPAIAHATPNNVAQLCSGASSSIDPAGTTCTNTTGSISNIIKFVLDIFSVIVGIAAVIMILVGGFKYIISGGDSTRVSGAKDTILFAIVGLVIVALAQVIVHFVLTNVSNQISG